MVESSNPKNKDAERHEVENDEIIERQMIELFDKQVKVHLKSLGKMVLTPEMSTRQPFEDAFVCSICYNCVEVPRQCRQCDSLNCQ